MDFNGISSNLIESVLQPIVMKTSQYFELIKFGTSLSKLSSIKDAVGQDKGGAKKRQRDAARALRWACDLASECLYFFYLWSSKSQCINPNNAIQLRCQQSNAYKLKHLPSSSLGHIHCGNQPWHLQTQQTGTGLYSEMRDDLSLRSSASSSVAAN